MTEPLLAIQKLGALYPANAAAEEAFKAIGHGKQVNVKLTGVTPNVRRMNLYWRVCGKVAENWPMESGSMTKSWLHDRTMKALGRHVATGKTKGGEDVFERASIRFAKMPEPERSEYIDEAFEFWAAALGVDVATLKNEAELAA